MSRDETIEPGRAGGRPMLQWVGKRPPERVPIFPAQPVETFDPLGAGDGGNLLFHGDNRDVLAWLLAHGHRNRVDMVYIDPPFASGADYVRRVQLRGVDGQNLAGAAHDLGEQVQYNDIWANDAYLQFMYERLLLLRELLAETGALYLHCDHRQEHYLRLLLEEVFGAENFLNKISWRSQVARGAKANAFYMGFSTHYIMIFAKDHHCTTWNPPTKQIVLSETEAAAKYMRDERGFFRTSDPGTYSFERLKELHAAGRLYAPYGGEPVIDQANGRVVASNGGNIGIKYYLKQVGRNRYAAERAVDNLWEDIPGLGTTPGEDVGYPTQKTEALLRRIIGMSTNPGETVLDCFAGSGTTLAVAQTMGRRWIGTDINRGSVQTISKRLRAIIAAQRADDGGASEDEDAPHPHSPPVALAFEVLRINNYDLSVPHAEAVRLVAEHVGMTRLRRDPFFDGTRGDALVKIVPFTHPLAVADLERTVAELTARADETRDAVLVCLGAETGVAGWLEQYNASRPTNRLSIIELRTDARYGRFLVHQPATARVSICRRGERIAIRIENFISPTIVQRLADEAQPVDVHLPDWRCMVDSVLIDPAYDGATFRVAVDDSPADKNAWVRGEYELPAPAEPTTVALKIIDMLGEEVLVTKEV